MSETRTDGFWNAEAREAAARVLHDRQPQLNPCYPWDEEAAEVLDALVPFVERMIEDERARAGQIMDRALADVQKASEDVQADLDAAASLARQAASDRARDCAAAEDVIRRRGIELGRLDAAGRKLAEAAVDLAEAGFPSDLDRCPGYWDAKRRVEQAVAASPWVDER